LHRATVTVGVICLGLLAGGSIGWAGVMGRPYQDDFSAPELQRQDPYQTYGLQRMWVVKDFSIAEVSEAIRNIKWTGVGGPAPVPWRVAGQQWAISAPRGPSPADTTTVPGQLSVQCAPGGRTEVYRSQSQPWNFVVTGTVVRPPSHPGSTAGLLLRRNDAVSVRLVVEAGSPPVIRLLSVCGGQRTSSEPLPVKDFPVRLKVQREEGRITGYFASADDDWQPLVSWDSNLESLWPGFVVSSAGSDDGAVFDDFAVKPMPARQVEVTANFAPEHNYYVWPYAPQPEGRWWWQTGRGPFEVPLLVANHQEQERKIVLAWELVDLEGRTVLTGQSNLSLPAGDSIPTTLSIDPQRYGCFTVWIRPYEKGRLVGMPERFVYCLEPEDRTDQLPPDSFFGHWERWHDWHPSYWSVFEPHRGHFVFGPIDERLQRNEREGRSVLWTLEGTPSWATRGSGQSAPQHMRDWEQMVRTVVSRYKGRINHYEVWNEPNNQGKSELLTGYFHGTIKDYFNILKATYLTAKEVDPNVKILGICGTGDYFYFMERVLQMGGMDYMDIVSIHTYTLPHGPEQGAGGLQGAVDERIRRTRTLMRKYGGRELPIWTTEIGWKVGMPIDGRPMTPQEVSDMADRERWPLWWPHWEGKPASGLANAAWLARHYIITYGEGCKHIFQWSGPSPGQHVTMAVVKDRLFDARPRGRVYLHPQVYAYRFWRPHDRTTVFTVWSVQKRPGILLISADEQADVNVFDMWGNPTDDVSQHGKLSLQLSDLPFYVEIGGDPQVQFQLLPGGPTACLKAPL